MPSDVLIPIISGASGLIGASVGAGAMLLAGRIQRNSERVKAVREQSELAARKCESLCNQLAKDVLELSRERRPNNAAAQARSERIESALPEVRAAALYLPGPLRERINEAAQIIYSSDDVARRHPHRVSPVTEVARDEVYAIVAAFLQEKKGKKRDLPKVNRLILEYRAALQDDDDSYVEELNVKWSALPRTTSPTEENMSSSIRGTRICVRPRKTTTVRLLVRGTRGSFWMARMRQCTCARTRSWLGRCGCRDAAGLSG